jgi:hypothetical protein
MPAPTPSPAFKDRLSAPHAAAALAVWAARRLALAGRTGCHGVDPAARRDVSTAHFVWGVELSGDTLFRLVPALVSRPLPGWSFAEPGCCQLTSDERAWLQALACLQRDDAVGGWRALSHNGCRAPGILGLARCYATDLALAGLELAK